MLFDLILLERVQCSLRLDLGRWLGHGGVGWVYFRDINCLHRTSPAFLELGMLLITFFSRFLFFSFFSFLEGGSGLPTSRRVSNSARAKVESFMGAAPPAKEKGPQSQDQQPHFKMVINSAAERSERERQRQREREWKRDIEKENKRESVC